MTYKPIGPLVVALLILAAFTAPAQDLNRLNKNDFLKVNGGLNFSTLFYQGTGAFTGRRAPFLWNAAGNLNADLLGYSMPVSFNISNRGIQGARSFNRFVLAPTYKWVRAQVGTATLGFSPYTYSGLTIKGAAVELSPEGPFKIAVIGGSLQEPLPFDGLQAESVKPAYRRWGGGIKAGYSRKGTTVEWVVFAARDNVASIPPVPESTPVKPASNLTTSLAFRKQLFKKWDLDLSYASSAYTGDLRTPYEYNSTFSLLRPFFRSRLDTRFFNQYGISTGYNGGRWQLMAKYEHVDPGYTTLGSAASNNDFENYTLAPALSLFKDVLKLNANVGLQRNNLDGKKPETSLRWIGSMNVAANLHPAWIVQGGYSNFTNFTNQRLSPNPFYRPVNDTLSIYQVSQNGNVAMVHPFGSKEHAQSLTWVGNYQETQSGSGKDVAATGKTRVYMTNIGYAHALTGKALTLGAAVNYYLTTLTSNKNAAFGPSLCVNAPLWKKKIQCGSNIAYNQTWVNGRSESGVVTANLRAAYTLGNTGNGKDPGTAGTSSGGNFAGQWKDKLFTNHSFSLNLNYMSRLPDGFRPGQSGSEFTLTLNYAWSF